MGTVVWIESFRLAFREMRRHRTRSMLTMLGVIIGVSAMIEVIAISQGAKRSIQDQIARVGSNMILVRPGSTSQGGVRAGAGSSSSLTMADAEAIASECSTVAFASPVTRTVCQAVSEWGNWAVPVQGVAPDYFDVRMWGVDSGRRIERRDVDGVAKVCLIGRSASRQLFGQVNPVGERIRVKGTVMQIVGLLAEKGQNPLGFDEDDTLLVPITTCFQHLMGDSRPNAIIASAKDEADIPLAMNQIGSLLRHRHHLRAGSLDDFTIKSIAEAAKTAERTSNIMTVLLVAIAAISLLVGGIGIMNIMLVTVMERTREIGIRMAIGATRRMIMHQFMIEAGTLAGVGGALGVLLGIAGSMVIAAATGWQAVLTPTLLVAPVVFAVVVGVLFGLLPARRASRLSPVESLRHD